MFSLLIRPIFVTRPPSTAQAGGLSVSVRPRAHMHWERAESGALIAHWTMIR